MNEAGMRRTLPEQSSGTHSHTFGTPHHPSVIDPIQSKRVCFYKSGDPQFNGLRIVINNRTFKTFDALLDSLSKKVPLPFGVRNITTPRGVHGIRTLDELEDGKSYICSDSRKVKPINLALARKKLPPWYHARPVSARRQIVQQGRLFPDRQGSVVMRTPRKLVVFRNGAPTVKHAVILHKKAAPNYKAILDYISERLQFRVLKLYTTDGRRVDGLPGLILSSGTVVAVGREPFRPAKYNVPKSPASTRRGTSLRRQRASNRKKKPSPFTTKSRNFSASSERYIVHQIHNTIAESSCDLPTHSTNSFELDSNRLLESVSEKDPRFGNEAEGRECSLPGEDNIEKSFRVNQDGSMTVEMKVRLTLKEEETVHWTTTLTRSSVAELVDAEAEAEKAIFSPKAESRDLESPAASLDTIKDQSKDNKDDDQDPPSLGNEAGSDWSHEGSECKVQTEASSPPRAPTPAYKTIRKQQASVESIQSLTPEGFCEGTMESYSCSQRTETGTMTERYCMVTQSTARPVPKPRKFSYVDASKPSEKTEMSPSDFSGEVTETVLHIYEQQTCQDNFLANVLAKGRPVTSESPQLSSNDNSELELLRPSTASESISTCRADSKSPTADSHLPSMGTRLGQNLKKGQDKYQQKEFREDTKLSIKPKSIKFVRRVGTPGKRLKENSEKVGLVRKKPKAFSSAGFLRKIYGAKSKFANSSKKPKKMSTPARRTDAVVINKNLIKTNVEASNTASALKEEKSSELSAPEVGPSRGMLTKQASMHVEEQSKKEDWMEGMSVHAFNSSSSVKYVESWLEKAHPNLPLSQVEHAPSQNKESEEKHCVGVIDDVTETSDMETCRTENLAAPSVKLQIQSLEHKFISPAEKTKTSMNTNRSWNLIQNGEREVKPLSNGICFEMIPPTPETSQEELPCDMELPPPPPELLNSEHSSKDVSPASSSPFHGLSSISGHRSDNQEFSLSPTSDDTAWPNGNAQADVPSSRQEAELSRTPSIKRAPLLSNLSLERKMSLKKACLDRYATGNDVTAESTESAAYRTVDEKSPSFGGHAADQPSPSDLACSPSLCTTASPVSLTSDERTSSASILSSEASMKMSKAPSPKASVKRAKLKNSPSPERKIQNKKSPAELQSHSLKLPAQKSHVPDKIMSTNISKQPRVTPKPSPSSEKKQYKTKELLKSSPYSQSLDVASPPVKQKSSRKTLFRNLSFDSPSEPSSRQLKTKSQRKTHQTPGTERSTTNFPQTLTSETFLPLESDACQNEVSAAKQNESLTAVRVSPQRFNPANRPNMTPVLEKICYSIKSIRQITQNKRPSCLEKSNSLPDFSSHVASTFGSSSKALLAFLAVMTLKEGLTHLNVTELNANNVSCAEALKMIDSLREIASIEDSRNLKDSLTNLQRSASKRLLDSWKDFQELSERRASRSSTPKTSKTNLTVPSGLKQDCNAEGNIIDEIMCNLELPERLKEELASLPDGANNPDDVEEEEFSAQIKQRLKLSTNPHIDPITNEFPTKDSGFQDSANIDVQSIIKKFTDTQQPETDCRNVKTETTKPKVNTDVKNSPELVARHMQVSDDREIQGLPTNMGSGEDVVQQEPKTQQQLHNDAKLTYKIENQTEEKTSNKKLEKEILKTKNREVKGERRQHEIQNDESISNSELSYGEKEEKVRESFTQSSETSDEQSSDEEVSFTKIKSDNKKAEDQPSTESPPKEENKQTEVQVRRKNLVCNLNRENLKLTEKQPRIDCKFPKSQTCSSGQNVQTDGSNENSSHPSSEDEQSSVVCKKLQVIVEESLSGNEEEQCEESIPELPKANRELEALIEESEEDQMRSDEELSNDDPKTPKLSESNLTISDSLEKDYRFHADDDSGNDHSGCGEHVDEERQHVEDGPIGCSMEDESSSEEEQSIFIKTGGTHRDLPVTTQPERVVVEFNNRPEDTETRSVAERVIRLEKQVADSQKTTTLSQSFRRFFQRKATLESDEEDASSESPTSEAALCTRSAPQSSLSFSYDSSGVITTEPEGSRVRSIREMFMARSARDVQQRHLPSSNSERSDLRAETSGSGGYQSQTSSELSSGEDDSARKSISKGFVRRTIERLYGKKETNPEEAGERPPSESNQGRKEHSSIFSPLLAARSKAMSEMSYFNSSNALEVFTEATRCIAFNAQVGPGDSVPIDSGRWFLKENTSIRKSLSDPIGINKTFTDESQVKISCKETEKPEEEDSARKCTYFSLPHASESEVIQDDVSIVSSEKTESVTDLKDDSEATETWAERNGMLPAIGVTDFKMKDNKVHPLVELPPDGEVVVMQPRKGQTIANRRTQEPDVLDLLYHFCGEHCPIL